MSPIRLASLGLALLALAACSGEPAAPESGALPALPTTAVKRMPVEASLRWTGIARAASSATLSAQTAGEVERIEVEVGDQVEAGALLIALRDAGPRAGRDQAAAGLSAARAEQVEAGKEIERVRALRESGLVAQAALDQATARFDAARAALRAARAAVTAAEETLGYARIDSPYAGVVTARHVESGEAVQPGQALLSLAAPGLWWVDVSLPSSAAIALSDDASASIEVAGEQLAASELRVFPATQADSQTATVRVVLRDDQGRVREGQALAASFSAPIRQALVVPAASVVRRSEVTAVYVPAADGRPLLRAVRLGAIQGDQVEVLAGLAEGEAVINDPAAALLVLRQSTEALRD